MAVFWAVLVLGLLVVLLNTFRVLESTKMTIDTMREEIVPLLREVKGSVERANRELDRVDTMLISATDIVGRVEKLSGLAEQAAASPLVKVISFGAGLRRASRAPRVAARSEARVLGRAGPGRRRHRRHHGQPLDQEAGAARRAAALAREAKGGLLDFSKLVRSRSRRASRPWPSAKPSSAPTTICARELTPPAA